ncbi:MAG TPA: winged helix-turn-helix domain-containing protein [Pyrinomonadaceae bacterium]|nr:winged helix-turn-helix domain-containing protein [Pyrinomonadaceae bacterium]
MNTTQAPDRNFYRFDDFSVDSQNFRVSKNGTAVTLTPRAFDVLDVLLRNTGQVVEKRQLFDEVWQETFVSDNALTKVIKELRHALHDAADSPRYIETVPKRGYRFIGDVTESPEPLNGSMPASETPAVVAAPASPSVKPWMLSLAFVALIGVAGATWYLLTDRTIANNPTTTIAVLPFKPLDAVSRDESLEFGMAATLITRLSNLREVIVRPMGSSRKFTDPAQDPVKAGEELQTDAVLDGSIQKVGDRVRVTVRLIDVKSGAALWSEQFDENFTDIFKVQDSIAQRIAGALALKLSRNEQEQLAKHMTESPEAYELYLKGQFTWHRRSPGWIRESLSLYEQALEKDPNFALAHIGVADAYIMLSGHRQLGVDDAAANAGPSIARALEIDNTLAQAHNVLAEFKYQYQYDWKGAEAEFKTALDLNPNVAWIHQAHGWFLMSDGRFDEANAEMERARQLDPSSMTLEAARGRLYYFSRQYDRAIQHYRAMLDKEPNDSSIHYALYCVYVQNHMYTEAVDMFLKNQRSGGMPHKHEQDLRDAFASGGWEGYQRKILSEIARQLGPSGQPSPERMTETYVRLRDKDNAFLWLNKLFDRRDISILQFKIEPAYDFLRDDPRYAQLLARIGQRP